MQLRLQGSDGLHAPGDTDTCWRQGAVEKHLHIPMHKYVYIDICSKPHKQNYTPVSSLHPLTKKILGKICAV